jgi:hypothetical protein
VSLRGNTIRRALLDHTLSPYLGFGRKAPRKWTHRLALERFWSLISALQWPDPLPAGADEIGVLNRLFFDRADRLVSATSFADRVAFQQRYLELVRDLAKRLWEWKEAGSPVALPGEVHAVDLADYAVQRGREAYEAALAGPEGASRLARQPGLLSLPLAQITFDHMVERALAQASDAEIDAFVDAFAVRDASSRRYLVEGDLVHHPRFGPGVVVRGDLWDRSTIEVVFADDKRVFTGDERRWKPVRERFVEAALDLLWSARAEVSEDRFWALVEPLGWGTRSTDSWELADALCARASLLERLGVLHCFMTMRDRLREALETWEKESLRKIAAEDDPVWQHRLVSHVVGLGRAEYEATLEQPERAVALADGLPWWDSFYYVVRGALVDSRREEVEALLREQAEASPAMARCLVEHPQHGIGVRLEEPGAPAVLFWDRELVATQG